MLLILLLLYSNKAIFRNLWLCGNLLKNLFIKVCILCFSVYFSSKLITDDNILQKLRQWLLKNKEYEPEPKKLIELIRVCRVFFINFFSCRLCTLLVFSRGKQHNWDAGYQVEYFGWILINSSKHLAKFIKINFMMNFLQKLRQWLLKKNKEYEPEPII